MPGNLNFSFQIDEVQRRIGKSRRADLTRRTSPDIEGGTCRVFRREAKSDRLALIEAKEVIGGYWMIDVKSKEEAVVWAMRIPAQDGDVIEIRQVFEMSDFPSDVQKAADNPRVKAQVEKRK